jgi:GrpB-like predicted nucleotidyltransferase (UPF0157 family)
MKVSILDYDTNRAALYADEKIKLLQALNGAEVEIEHIGSTSVAGLAAKPIIDIMMGLKDFAAADQLVPKIVAAGYAYIKKFEIEMPYRRYLTKGSPHTHHIHLVAIGSEFWMRHLLFRDYLRTDSGLRDEYAKLKKSLAELEWNDVNEYCDAKIAFIRKAEKEAEEFFSKG